MKFTEVLGLLGFALSVIVFVLTRWEQRKTLIVDVECAQGEKFKDEAGEYNETMIVIRAINVGAKSIVIDKTSIIIEGPKKNVRTYEADWFGLDRIPHPLSPGESFEIGLFLESFAHFQGYKSIEHSTDILAISVNLSDIEGISYKTKSKYELLLEVNEIRRLR